MSSGRRGKSKPEQGLDPLTIRDLPRPGGASVFSEARLHETVPNATDFAAVQQPFQHGPP
jgi:hypothetical protein